MSTAGTKRAHFVPDPLQARTKTNHVTVDISSKEGGEGRRAPGRPRGAHPIGRVGRGLADSFPGPSCREQDPAPGTPLHRLLALSQAFNLLAWQMLSLRSDSFLGRGGKHDTQTHGFNLFLRRNFWRIPCYTSHAEKPTQSKAFRLPLIGCSLPFQVPTCYHSLHLPTPKHTHTHPLHLLTPTHTHALRFHVLPRLCLQHFSAPNELLFNLQSLGKGTLSCHKTFLPPFHCHSSPS